jgi:hypothetical protein
VESSCECVNEMLEISRVATRLVGSRVVLNSIELVIVDGEERSLFI